MTPNNQPPIHPLIKTLAKASFVLGLIALVIVITLIGTDTAILVGVVTAYAFGVGFLAGITNEGLAKVILVGSTAAIGVIGFLTSIVADIFYPTRLVDMFTEMVLPISLGLSIVATLLLFPFAAKVFKKERLYPSLLCFWLASSSSLMLFTWGALIFTNGALDKSATKLITVELVGKDSFSDGKRTDYWIQFRDWHQGDQEESLDVTRHFWESVKKGDKVNLIVKEGFHGYEWVVSYSEERP